MQVVMGDPVWLRPHVPNFTPTAYYFLHVTIKVSRGSSLCHLQHKLIGFYNRDECLQRGTNWVFK